MKTLRSCLILLSSFFLCFLAFSLWCPYVLYPLLDLHGSPSPAPACLHLECPPYKLVHEESDFEIRLYRTATWTATDPLLDVSFQKATVRGFQRLFQYIQGRNKDGVKIPMTAPVLTSIHPSAGPFCSSAFVVHFLLPGKFSEEPPKPQSELKLHTLHLKDRCVAVRKFGGWASDLNVAQEAKLLADSLSRTPWQNVTAESTSKARNESYAIAQYNSPFEVFSTRVNEVWVPFNSEDVGMEHCAPSALLAVS